MKKVIQKNKIYFDDKEEEKIYYSRWENENTLVNQRLTWLLISQGLLFGAYGTIGTKSIDACKEKSEFLIKIVNSISTAGAVLSLIILAGILAAIVAQIKLHNIYKPKGSTIGVCTITTLVGWATCLAPPAIFLFAWIVLPEPKPISDRNQSCYATSSNTKTNDENMSLNANKVQKRA